MSGIGNHEYSTDYKSIWKPDLAICPYCGDEMIRGYLMSSRDITFAVDNPTKVFFV